MKISLILVNWNSWDYSAQALESMRADLSGVVHEIFFIDNYSDENKTDFLKTQFKDLNILFERNASNLGFAKAVNQGLAKAKGEYVLLINPDIEIRHGSILNSLKYMELHNEVGFLGSRLLNSDGSLQKWTAGNFPSVSSAFNHYFFLSSLSNSFKGMFLGRDYDSAVEVDWLCGAFLMIRFKMLKEIGFLDESFFMYAEDMDWCLRAKQKGWKVIYYPEAQVIHHSGKSMAKFKKERFWRGLFSISSFYARTRSKGIGLLFFNAITALGYLLRAFLFLIRGAWQKAQQSFEFAKAAFAILFGLNFLYRSR